MKIPSYIESKVQAFSDQPLEWYKTTPNENLISQKSTMNPKNDISTFIITIWWLWPLNTWEAINSLILSTFEVKYYQGNKSSNLENEVQKDGQCCKHESIENRYKKKHKEELECWKSFLLTSKHGEDSNSWHFNISTNSKS